MATQFPKTDKEPCSKPEEMTAPVSNMEQKLQEEKQQTENSDQGPVSNPLPTAQSGYVALAKLLNFSRPQFLYG